MKKLEGLGLGYSATSIRAVVEGALNEAIMLVTLT